MERDQFIARVTTALRRGRTLRGDPATPWSPLSPVPSPLLPGPTDREAMMRLFAERLHEVGGVATAVVTRDVALASIAQLLRDRDMTRIATPIALRWQAIEDLWTDDCRKADVGLSAAEWGIAETGSVVLRHQGQHGRAFSLVPPVVGFLLPASRLVPRLGPVLAALADDPAGPPACVTFVSGASHSADIASVTCVGVHGPAEVHVWLIADE